jgi:excisionase family DNA binding protein
MAKYVPEHPIVEPLAWRIPEAARRAGMRETKFRELVKQGRVGFVEYGHDRLIPDDEIRRLLRNVKFEGGEQA